jgi:hypothetical protein
MRAALTRPVRLRARRGDRIRTWPSDRCNVTGGIRGIALGWTTASGGMTLVSFIAACRRGSEGKSSHSNGSKDRSFFYNAVRNGMDYADPGASYYQERYRQRVLTNPPTPPDRVGGRRAGNLFGGILLPLS